MLLCVDVGNTNTGIGLFDDKELVAQWRVETALGRTYDEYAVLLRELFNLNDLPWPSVSAAIISTVVPSVQFPVEELCKRYLKVSPLVVGPGIKTGMPILYENPREVGADRIVNARSASCSDFTSLWVHTTGRGKTFGAASHGAFGQAAGSTALPNWELRNNDILCSDTAGNLLQGHPPAPDFPVTYTAAEIRQGVDAVVEAARVWVVSQ